jgi:hypothetical protein
VSDLEVREERDGDESSEGLEGDGGDGDDEEANVPSDTEPGLLEPRWRRRVKAMRAANRANPLAMRDRGNGACRDQPVTSGLQSGARFAWPS